MGISSGFSKDGELGNPVYMETFNENHRIYFKWVIFHCDFTTAESHTWVNSPRVKNPHTTTTFGS